MRYFTDRPQLVRLLLVAGIFLFGGTVGWFIGNSGTFSYQPYRETNSDYEFIAPLLFVDIDEEYAFPKYSELKRAIESHVQKAEARDDVLNVSVYFRNVNTSQWVAVNPDERFAPASMLKVVTLMTVLRASEEDPSLLNKRVRPEGIEKSFPIERTIYEPKHPVQSGQVYTVDALLRQLIVESDNGANFALMDLMGDERIQATYDALQLERTVDSNAPGYQAREYSRVFRALYNGTYLSHSLSEQVLKLLSTTAFTDGIVSGVPVGTVVSHKFGVRSAAASDEALERGEFEYHELHDCGIVYHLRAPYFICVMTRGRDLSVLESVIQDVSKITWEEVGEVSK